MGVGTAHDRTTRPWHLPCAVVGPVADGKGLSRATPPTQEHDLGVNQGNVPLRLVDMQSVRLTHSPRNFLMSSSVPNLSESSFLPGTLFSRWSAIAHSPSHVLKPAELPKVLALFKTAAEKISKQNIDHWQYWKNPPAAKVKWVKEGILNHEFFFIENDNQETIGMVRILDEDLLYWGQKDERAKYIHSLVVVDEFAGKGIGKKIIQEIASKANAEGVQFLRLDCDAKNPKLCQYYEKQGFNKVGEKTLPLSTNNLYEKSIERREVKYE